jgi:hypothetical protein
MPKVLVNEAKRGAGKRGNGGDQAASASALLLNSVPKVGVWVWTFVGLVLVLILVVTALSAVSEIVLPLTFAAVLHRPRCHGSGSSDRCLRRRGAGQRW